MNKNLSDQQVIKYIKQGLSYTQIYKKGKISYTRVKSLANKNKLKLRKLARGGQNSIDISNQKFGSLIVLKRAKKDNIKVACWKCKCACGNECIAVSSDLRNGKTKTCGCRISIKSRRNWQGYGNIPKTYWKAVYHNSQQRNREFTVTIEEANLLFVQQNEKCKLSGVSISFKNKTASLDRIDSSKGYIKENVQWIHKDLQKMKHAMSDAQFIDWCHIIANHNPIL
jgi:hypothetical protein